MPIYTFKCPRCEEVVEKLVKNVDAIVFCECEFDMYTVSGAIRQAHPEMQLVPSVPSPMQWGCRKF